MEGEGKDGGLISHRRHTRMRKAVIRSTSHRHRERAGPHTWPTFSILLHDSPYVRSMVDSLALDDMFALVRNEMISSYAAP